MNVWRSFVVITSYFRPISLKMWGSGGIGVDFQKVLLEFIL